MYASDGDARRTGFTGERVADGDRWNADVMIRRTLSSDKPRHHRVTCDKLPAHHAERAGLVWGRSAGSTCNRTTGQRRRVSDADSF